MIPFAVKIGAAIMGLSVGAVTISVLLMYSSTRDFLIGQMQERLKDIGRTGSFLIEEKDRNTIKRLAAVIRSNASYDEKVLKSIEPGNTLDVLSKKEIQSLKNDPGFKRLVQILRKIKVGTQRAVYPDTRFKQEYTFSRKPPALNYVYLWVPVSVEEKTPFVFFIADADHEAIGDEPGVNPGSIYNASELPGVLGALKGFASAEDEFYSDWSSTSLEAGIPIKDSEGRPFALLGVNIRVDSEVNRLDDLKVSSFIIVGGTFLLSIFLTYLFARLFSGPVRKLKEGAEKVKKRDFSTRIDIKTRDELEVFAGTFNEMVDEIRDYATNLETLNTAYYRFVPREFLKHLGKESIVKVELGDQVSTRTTILFSDIRSFTSISEGLSPEQNFAFLNQYLQHVAPVIQKNHGFIDKYIGDAVMALFMRSPEDALRAAIEMLTGVHQLNQLRMTEGDKPIKIGIGLHSGDSMLGTIGSAERMEGTVISDSVNIASRLEGITKKFGATLIASQSVLDFCDGEYLYRYLGLVNVKGKKHGIQIYEILNGLDSEETRLKLSTKNDFEAGLEQFQKGKFNEAQTFFKKVLRVNREDKAARVYMSRCVKPEHEGGSGLSFNSK